MLKIIQVGHMEASDRYIRNKIRAIEAEGLEAEVVNLPEDCNTSDVLAEISHASENATAIMVQLPLPAHIDTQKVLRSIPEDRDIDGLNPHSDYQPLTPCAIMRWFRELGIDLAGKTVSILGRSDLVGKPLANLMIEAGATVCVLNSKTPNFIKKDFLSVSDIVVSAVGKVGVVDEHDFYRHDFCNFSKIIIDVGINRGEDGKLCGDVSKELFDFINSHVGICTPVPGGVGKWTVRELVLRLKEMESNNA